MRVFFAALALVLPAKTFAHDHATAHYLGNAGVMIVRGDTKILFDAFYADSYGQYALVPNGVSEAMKKGEEPYDGVDAIFVSHVHGDHFTAQPAIDYMRAQRDVVLFAPQQVLDAIMLSGVEKGDPLLARVRAFTLAPEDGGEEISFGELDIDVVSVPHAGDRPHIQNYAWRVTLDDDTTVIHLGDADPVVSNFSRHQAHFNRKETHTAFPPYWFVGNRNGKLIIKDVIKADQCIGVHVPARAIGNGDQWRNKAGDDLFTDPGEIRVIGQQNR